MPKITTRKITFAGIVAALYAVITIALGFIGYGPVQFRIAEALCILPFFFPASVWGLFVGCIISNLMSPYPLDVVAGALATLIAALCTMWAGKSGRGSVMMKALACLPPVVFNAVIIGALIAYYMVGAVNADVFMAAFMLNGLQVGLGELAVMFVIGLPIMIYFPRTRAFAKLSTQYYYSR